jgi:glycosyltransferase involved in cell wall biosynthesis
MADRRDQTPNAERRRPTPQAADGRPTRLLVVTNIYPTPDRPNMSPFVARRVAALRERGVDVVVARHTSYRRNSLLRHIGITWRALTARGPFDGVEAHPVYVAGVIGLIAARLRRVPMVAYAHGGDVADYALRNRIHGSLARWVVRGAGAIVANSQNTAGFVERLGAKARVISPGLDLTLFRPQRGGNEVEGADSSLNSGAAGGAAALAAERARLGAPAGLLALYVGMLSERKGADVFAAALDLAGSGGRTGNAAPAAGAAGAWSGVMVGEGPLAGGIAARHPAVRLVAPTPPADVAAWMRAADVVVVPSRREPLGLAAVEALACGTPVIASNTGGLPEVVRDGENGLLIPPDDPAALAAALGRLADPVLRARLGAAGPASVAGHDIRAAAAKMAEVWAELGVTA